MAFRISPFTVCLLASLWLAGACSHYQLGTNATLAFHTLYVAPVESKIPLAQAQELVSTQLREAFARDSRITLVNSPESAEATLTVVLNDFRRDVAVARENDTGLARKFNLTLGANCTLRDNRAARPLFENRAVSVQREAFTDSLQIRSAPVTNQLQSEYQTLPLLAESFAAKVVHTVLDVW